MRYFRFIALLISVLLFSQETAYPYHEVQEVQIESSEVKEERIGHQIKKNDTQANLYKRPIELHVDNTNLADCITQHTFPRKLHILNCTFLI